MTYRQMILGLRIHAWEESQPAEHDIPFGLSIVFEPCGFWDLFVSVGIIPLSQLEGMFDH